MRYSITPVRWQSRELGRGLMMFRGKDKKYVVWQTKLGKSGINLVGYNLVGEFKTSTEALDCFDRYKAKLQEQEEA